MSLMAFSAFFNDKFFEKKKLKKQQQLQEWIREKEARALEIAAKQDEERTAMREAGKVLLLFNFWNAEIFLALYVWVLK
jgi:hypothetical protein